jgi:hypothetical protein
MKLSAVLSRFSSLFHYRPLYLCILLLFVASSTTACSSNEPVASSPSTPTSPRDKSALVASEWLNKARLAAQGMNKYSFELQLNQELSGKDKSDQSTVKIDMQGRVERNPLKLDQTIHSDIDGEASTLRSIVVPDAYYMYMPEYEEWSKLSKELSKENTETLSDFQVNPDKALEDIQALGGALQAEQVEDVVTIRYEGSGAEAKIYLSSMLQSTMGLSSADSEVVESMDISALTVTLTMDAKKHWPLSYRVESEMNIALEPGRVTKLNQTLTGAYSEHNNITPVTVPKEAEQAIDPDKIEEELDLDLDLK